MRFTEEIRRRSLSISWDLMDGFLAANSALIAIALANKIDLSIFRALHHL
jgi:hypothetical protein